MSILGGQGLGAGATTRWGHMLSLCPGYLSWMLLSELSLNAVVAAA